MPYHKWSDIKRKRVEREPLSEEEAAERAAQRLNMVAERSLALTRYVCLARTVRR